MLHVAPLPRNLSLLQYGWDVDISQQQLVQQHAQLQVQQQEIQTTGTSSQSRDAAVKQVRI